jgi:parallel beta-helix repeat protein
MLSANAETYSIKNISEQKDSTRYIQSWIDYLKPGDTLILSNGVYLINVVDGGLYLKSDMVLRLSKKTILRAIPNKISDATAIIAVSGIKNVRITGSGGAALQGERYGHKSSGNHGMGIWVRWSDNVKIDNLITKDNLGDGIYLSGRTRNTTIDHVLSKNNRRQGISIVHADGVAIKYSTFTKTGGTSPGCGIAIEANPGTQIHNIFIYRSQFSYNAYCGLYTHNRNGKVSNITIQESKEMGNKKHGVILTKSIPGIKLINNNFEKLRY